jgi:hypothetical protein
MAGGIEADSYSHSGSCYTLDYESLPLLCSHLVNIHMDDKYLQFFKSIQKDLSTYISKFPCHQFSTDPPSRTQTV